MPTAFLRTGGQCCPCEQRTGCSCGPCALECRAKSGIAELCGFDEFEPSVPPKKYRRRTIGPVTPGSPFMVCGPMDFPDCTPPDCPGVYSGEFNGFIPGFPFEFHVTGSLVQGATVAGVTTYTAHCAATNDSAPGVPRGCRISINRLGVTHNLSDGDTIGLNVAEEWGVNLQVETTVGDFATVDTACITVGLQPFPITADVWSLEQHYDAATCELIQDADASQRCNAVGYSCIEPTVPDDCVTVEAIPCVSPETCYGDNANVGASSGEPPSRTISGVGCIDNGDGTGTQSSGDVLEALSTEDTEDDAIGRAAVEADLVPAAEGCATVPAFITERGAGEFSFGYRRTQVRARLHDVSPSTTFNVTIKFYRRVVGTGSPFLFFSTLTLTLTSDANPATDEYSAWIDVPNERGYETRPQLCEVAEA